MDPDHEWFVKKLWKDDYDQCDDKHFAEGAFGDVFKVRRKDSPNGEVRALKEIMKNKVRRPPPPHLWPRPWRWPAATAAGATPAGPPSSLAYARSRPKAVPVTV